VTRILILTVLVVALAGCGSAAVVDRPDRVSNPTLVDRPDSTLLDRAENAYLSGDFATAAESYQRFATSYSSSGYAAAAWYWCGRSSLAGGDRLGARRAFENAGGNRGEIGGIARLQLARIEMMDSRYSQAATLYEEGLSMLSSIVPRQVVLSVEYYRAGVAHIRAGNWTAGRKWMTQCHLRFPQSREANKAREVLSISENRFFVQLGAFRDRANAIRRTDELHRKGVSSAGIRTVHLNGEVWHYIIGPTYDRYDDAAARARSFKVDGIDAFARP
jgi:tetratricopeptide (TPR) repeat protein